MIGSGSSIWMGLLPIAVLRHNHFRMYSPEVFHGREPYGKREETDMDFFVEKRFGGYGGHQGQDGPEAAGDNADDGNRKMKRILRPVKIGITGMAGRKIQYPFLLNRR